MANAHRQLSRGLKPGFRTIIGGACQLVLHGSRRWQHCQFRLRRLSVNVRHWRAWATHRPEQAPAIPFRIVLRRQCSMDNGAKHRASYPQAIKTLLAWFHLRQSLSNFSGVGAWCLSKSPEISLQNVVGKTVIRSLCKSGNNSRCQPIRKVTHVIFQPLVNFASPLSCNNCRCSGHHLASFFSFCCQQPSASAHYGNNGHPCSCVPL